MTRVLRLVALAALLAAGPGRAEWTGAVGSEIPLDGDGKAWLVHATLNGSVTGVFLLDTGASYCVLAPSTARRLGLAVSGTQADVTTANGAVRVPVVSLRTVQVGSNRARDVPAIIHTAVGPPLDGVIGLSYLNNFSYSVDPKKRTLRLR
jgi:clan AA aspartic protease (TIGR02281 family)